MIKLQSFFYIHPSFKKKRARHVCQSSSPGEVESYHHQTAKAKVGEEKKGAPPGKGKKKKRGRTTESSTQTDTRIE